MCVCGLSFFPKEMHAKDKSKHFKGILCLARTFYISQLINLLLFGIEIQPLICILSIKQSYFKKKAKQIWYTLYCLDHNILTTLEYLMLYTLYSIFISVMCSAWNFIIYVRVASKIFTLYLNSISHMNNLWHHTVKKKSRPVAEIILLTTFRIYFW